MGKPFEVLSEEFQVHIELITAFGVFPARFCQVRYEAGKALEVTCWRFRNGFDQTFNSCRGPGSSVSKVS